MVVLGFNFQARQNELDGKNGRKLNVIEEKFGRYTQNFYCYFVLCDFNEMLLHLVTLFLSSVGRNLSQYTSFLRVFSCVLVCWNNIALPPEVIACSVLDIYF